jgi:hypothetical protein
VGGWGVGGGQMIVLQTTATKATAALTLRPSVMIGGSCAKSPHKTSWMPPNAGSLWAWAACCATEPYEPRTNETMSSMASRNSPCEWQKQLPSLEAERHQHYVSAHHTTPSLTDTIEISSITSARVVIKRSRLSLARQLMKCL